MQEKEGRSHDKIPLEGTVSHARHDTDTIIRNNGGAPADNFSDLHGVGKTLAC